MADRQRDPKPTGGISGTLNSSLAGMEQATQLLLEPGREWLREMASRDQL